MRTLTKAQLDRLKSGQNEFIICNDHIDCYTESGRFSHQIMVMMTYRYLDCKFYYEDVRFVSTKKGRRSKEMKQAFERILNRMIKRNNDVIDLYGYFSWR